jgi:AcrR family transcriptional regulator
MTSARLASQTLKPGPRRRPETGGYARGDEVRIRILLAAIKLFGELGFARASTRTIAARAEVNPPALHYYFHNKARLHEACGEYIAGRIAAHLREPMARAFQVLEAKDRPAVEGVLWDIVESIVDHSSNDAEIPGWPQFLARAGVEGDGASLTSVISREAVDPLVDLLAALFALAWGRAAHDEEARMAAALLMSQARAFGSDIQTTLKMMKWSEWEGDRIDFGKRCLRSALRGLTASPLLP